MGCSLIGKLAGAQLTKALATACAVLLLLLIASLIGNVWQWRVGSAAVLQLTGQLAGEKAARTIDVATCAATNAGANATAKRLQELLLECRVEKQEAADALKRALAQREADRGAAAERARQRSDAINRLVTDHACPPAPICRALSDQLLGREADAADQRTDPD